MDRGAGAGEERRRLRVVQVGPDTGRPSNVRMPGDAARFRRSEASFEGLSCRRLRIAGPFPTDAARSPASSNPAPVAPLPRTHEDHALAKYATECVGTFFLVLVVGLCVAQGLGVVGTAVAVGLMLTGLVYMGGPISRAHYNPAITLAFALRGRIDRSDVGPYLAAQVLGAGAASMTVVGVHGSGFALAPGPEVAIGWALALEAAFTFVLALVILNVAIGERSAGNGHYGLAIGATVAGAAASIGGVSGGAMNPAVGVVPALVRAIIAEGPWSHAWIYLVGPSIGAALAAAMFGWQERRVDPIERSRG